MEREMPVSRVFLYISFRIPSKGSLFQVPFVELLERERERERDTLCFQSSSSLFQSPR
jgi:hypothetical protein